MYFQSAENFNIKPGGTCPHTLRIVSNGVPDTRQFGLYNNPIKSGANRLKQHATC